MSTAYTYSNGDIQVASGSDNYQVFLSVLSATSTQVTLLVSVNMHPRTPILQKEYTLDFSSSTPVNLSADGLALAGNITSSNLTNNNFLFWIYSFTGTLSVSDKTLITFDNQMLGFLAENK